MLNRDQDKSVLYTKLQLWESARADDFGLVKGNAKKGKDALTQAIIVRVRAHILGRDLDAFRKEISNGCVARSMGQLHNVAEVNRHMECYEPMFHKKKKDEGGVLVGGSHHLQSGDGQ